MLTVEIRILVPPNSTYNRHLKIVYFNYYYYLRNGKTSRVFSYKKITHGNNNPGILDPEKNNPPEKITSEF